MKILPIAELLQPFKFNSQNLLKMISELEKLQEKKLLAYLLADWLSVQLENSHVKYILLFPRLLIQQFLSLVSIEFLLEHKLSLGLLV